MLPSMPILFSRDSLDAFGNKIVASTSSCYKNNNGEPAIMCEPQPSASKQEPQPSTSQQITTTTTKKEQPSDDNTQGTVDSETEWCSRYLSKVQQRLSPNSRAHNTKFLEFKEILKNFDPGKNTPIDLHMKLKEFFGEQHKELSDDFVLFLKPEQALQIGEYSNQMQMYQMKNFIDTLASTYARKPTVLRKIVRAITNSVNCGSLDEMRARVVPHLRSSPRLTAMFRSLFPDERLPDSILEADMEKLNDDFLTNETEYDCLAIEDAGENRRNIDSKDSLDTMYLQGRVFLQYGRNLRPANITFPYSKEPYRNQVRRLAPLLCRVSPPHSSDEETTRKNKNTKANKKNKKQTKSQRNLIKDVNDNTKHKRTDSPKITKTQNRHKKDVEKPETNTKGKKERHDSKGDNKNDIPKAKQAKIETVTVDTQKTKMKIETEVKPETKLKDVETKTKQNSNQKTKLKDTAVNEVPKLKVKETPKCDMRRSIKLETKLRNIEATNKNYTPKAKQAKLEVTAVTQNKLEVNSWTRDEDKTLLQVLKGESISEHVFVKINRLLPHRSQTEIKERFFHVMNLLQKMSVGEVT